MARQRVTRNELLDYIEPIEPPFIARLTFDGPLHIIKERAKVDKLDFDRSHYEITGCNRVTYWPHRLRNFSAVHDDPICKRCGTRDDFLNATEVLKVWLIQQDHKRENERALKDAELVALRSWRYLGEQIEEQINDDLEQVVASGQILVPLSKDEIKRLRTLVYRDIQQTFGGVTDVGLPRLTKMLYEKLRDYDE